MDKFLVLSTERTLPATIFSSARLLLFFICFWLSIHSCVFLYFTFRQFRPRQYQISRWPVTRSLNLQLRTFIIVLIWALEQLCLGTLLSSEIFSFCTEAYLCTEGWSFTLLWWSRSPGLWFSSRSAVQFCRGAEDWRLEQKTWWPCHLCTARWRVWSHNVDTMSCWVVLTQHWGISTAELDQIWFGIKYFSALY